MSRDEDRLEAGEYVARIEGFEAPNESFSVPELRHRIWKHLILRIRGREVRTPLFYECEETDVTGRFITLFPEVEMEREMYGAFIKVRISKSGYVSDVFADLRTPTIEQQRTRRENIKRKKMSFSETVFKNRRDWMRENFLRILEEED